MKLITTDNASDMLAAMRLLRVDLTLVLGKSSNGDDGFHVRCMADVIILALKECISKVHSKVFSMPKLVGASRSSVERRHLFETIKNKINGLWGMLNMDKVTKWSSMFDLISQLFKVRRVLNAVMNLLKNSTDYEISDMECRLAENVCSFLSHVPGYSKHQS